jgi:hypothetical protein
MGRRGGHLSISKAEVTMRSFRVQFVQDFGSYRRGEVYMLPENECIDLAQRRVIVYYVW